MRKDFEYDLYRINGCFNGLFIQLLKDRSYRKLFFYRKLRESSGVKKSLYRLLSILFTRNSGIELAPSVEIGKGCMFIHPYGITFNSQCNIGDNFTILKGATIGNIKEGKKAGSPTIGNNVYVGLNSTIVGGVTIGDNVLVAANTFVNFDVPSDSIVIGSPGVIHYRKNASFPYIYNSIFGK